MIPIRTTNLSQRLHEELGDVANAREDQSVSVSPFDERMEDQENEEFFRSVQPHPVNSRGSTLASGSSYSGATSSSQPIAREPQPLKVESVKKYKEHAAELAKGKQQQQKQTKEQALQACERAPRLVPVTETGDDAKHKPSVSVQAPSSSAGRSPEEHRGEKRLQEDIYSLIYTANLCSQAFAFACFVFVFQETLLLLILFDEVDFWDGDGNVWEIPPGVPVRVNVAQAISMILILSSMLGDSGDLPNGVIRLVNGYHVNVLVKNPHASFGKWFVAGVVQASVGLTMTVVLFFLVMQSTTVLGLTLNFAALSFVMDIDNITFQMGKEGFLTRNIQKACQRVEHHWVPNWNAKRTRICQNLMVVILLVALFVPYGFLVNAQWNAKYVCSKIFIQFKDEGIPYLSYYTGNFYLYQMENTIFGGIKARIDSRVYFLDETETLKLAYCNKELAWTISLAEVNDHCLYLYKSTSPTTTFDVTTIGSMPWVSWSFEQRRTTPVDLYLTCNDCDDGPRGNCHGHNGQCIENECRCYDNNTGIACEQILPGCERLRLDARFNRFPFEAGASFSDFFEILRFPEDGKIFLANERPVYVSYYSVAPGNATGRSNLTDTGTASSELDGRGVDILFFNGRRWVILARDHPHFINKHSNRHLREIGSGEDSRLYSVYEGQENYDNNMHPRERRLHEDDPHDGAMTVEYAMMDVFGTENEFDEKVLPLVLNLTELLGITYERPIDDVKKYFYRPYFFSAPVEPLTANDVLDPVGLDWYRSYRASSHLMSQWSHDGSQALGTVFLCGDCHWWSNRCMNAGFCNETTSTCECAEYYGGALCERPLTCHEKGSCENGGTCEAWKDYCTCPGNFFGSLCQYDGLKNFAEIPPVPN
ncbi:multiple EGF-like-domains 6 [Seminavis robusta]|uniref:Multiple EGF-like-domains 6 n=1 Tax=Seminavis robusta TaxID=568900 RepID=A0A9N8E7I9_9STRA|nr:multiple EGF-like-domains 6 [Seminavis robusta]|eukprot:Sro705_g190340.1 multiple EGF-like-domains 6 (877) ;mRNA; r:23450-26344